jgi:Phosphodiester glycosidase
MMIATAATLGALGAGSPAAAWEALEPGLEVADFVGPPSGIGDRHIRVLRVDPARFQLELGSASAAKDGRPLTAREWVAQKGALAAINASMFRDDGRTSVGLMRTRAHVNNPRLAKQNAVLAFDPRSGKLPQVELLDRACDDFAAASAAYGTLVQSIRMISCDGHNVWAPSARKWSTAAIGTDTSGRVLFIHARTPWPVHELTAALLGLPIDLRRAMYVEGGPEAQLFIRAGGRELEAVGSFETGFNENDDNHEAWPIPNVVLVTRRR